MGLAAVTAALARAAIVGAACATLATFALPVAAYRSAGAAVSATEIRHLFDAVAVPLGGTAVVVLSANARLDSPVTAARVVVSLATIVGEGRGRKGEAEHENQCESSHTVTSGCPVTVLNATTGNKSGVPVCPEVARRVPETEGRWPSCRPDQTDPTDPTDPMAAPWPGWSGPTTPLRPPAACVTVLLTEATPIWATTFWKQPT